MTVGTTPGFSPSTALTRKVPRYKLTVPLDLTVLRSGVPDNIPGRTLEIGEGGMGVVVASQLLLGESVRVEFLLPHMSTPVRATAVVRYQRAQCFGLQFLRLPEEQQAVIRYWTRHEGDISFAAHKNHPAPGGATREDARVKPTLFSAFVESETSHRRSRNRRILAFAVAMAVVAVTLGWWRWEQGWNDLEAQVPARQAVLEKPQLTIPAETMQRRLIHQVPPEYPADARRAGLQGSVVLDTVVTGEGSVAQVKAASGPEALLPAAMDAVRWWRYEPYVVNGRPVTVATTVRVDFRLADKAN